MITAVVIFAIIMTILLSGFFSGAETAAYSSSEIKLRHMSESGNANAFSIVTMLNRLPEFIILTLIGNNITIYCMTYITTSFMESLRLDKADIWATILLTPLCFVFAEVLPKEMASSSGSSFLLKSTRPLKLLSKILWPLTVLLGLYSRLLNALLIRFNLHPTPIKGRPGLLENFEAENASGNLSDFQHEIATRALEIESLPISDVMISAKIALTVKESATCEEAALMMTDAGFNRCFIIDRTGQLTNRIVTLNAIMQSPAALDQPAHTISTEAISLDQGTSICKALHKMRENATLVALVSSRRGNFVGIITISRLLSKLIGTARY